MPRTRAWRHHQPHKRVGQVAPQQRRHQDGDADQHAAHGRRAALFLVALRAFFADVLADLKLPQPLDDERPDQQPDQQRRQARKHAAKRQIAEDAKERKVREKLLVQQPIEQVVPPGRRPPCAANIAYLTTARCCKAHPGMSAKHPVERRFLPMYTGRHEPDGSRNRAGRQPGSVPYPAHKKVPHPLSCGFFCHAAASCGL